VAIERRFAVLGLGGIGSAVAYGLSRRAEGDVIGLERFELGHGRGASEDHSRIVRRSYHTPGYVRLADAAYGAWASLEKEVGSSLLVQTGGLDLWPRGAAIAMEDYTSALEAEGVPFELIDGDEVMSRWPQWRLEDGVQAVFQEDGAIAPASRCNEAHRTLAREHGALLRDRSPVVDVEDRGGEVTLNVDGELIHCEHLVVCADAWTNDVLAMLGVSPLPLTITKEQVVYLEPTRADLFHPDRFPLWIWMDDPSFYGFPAFGEPAPKVAQDVGGPRLSHPDRRGDDPDPGALARVRDFVERHLPDAAGPERLVRVCQYTMPPDRDFVLDRVPEHPNVTVVLGAAHGFKFASLFGRVVAELLLDGSTSFDLSPFRWDRPALTDLDFEPSFLV
jgi:sarcosine oxidase